MTTDNSNAGDSSKSDDNEDLSAGEPDGEKHLSAEKLQAERDEAIRRRDSAAKRAREAEKRLAALEAERAAEEAERANKSSDVEAIKKSFETKLSTFEQKLRDKEEALRRHVIRNSVTKHAADKVADLDDFWNLTQNSFDVELDEDGVEVAVVKNNPTQTIAEFVEEFLARKPHFAKNPRKSGSGTNVKADQSESQARPSNIADLAKQPDKGRAAMMKDPNLARSLLRSLDGKIG